MRRLLDLPLRGLPVALLAPLLLCVRPGPALAAEPPPLTLDALLRDVARRSPELRARAAEVRAAQARPQQARAFEDPMLMTELWQVPTRLTQVPLMVTLRQPIPWPGKLSARAAALAPDIARAEAQTRVTARGLRQEATRLYYDYALAVRSLEVQRRSRQLLHDLVAAVDLRYRVGKAELAELLAVQQELATLDNSLLDQERQRDLAITALNTLLAQPADQPLGPPATVPAPRPLPALAEATALALAQRPELSVARAGVLQARARGEAARAERAPDLAVWAGYMAVLRGDMDNTFTVGLQTSLPTFSLVRSFAAAREAQAEGQAQAAGLSQTEARIRGEVRAALLQAETAARHLRLHGETLGPLAEQGVRSAQVSYQTGRASLVLLLEATRTLVAHRLQYEQYVADYGQRLGDLEAALGGPLPAAPGAGGAP